MICCEGFDSSKTVRSICVLTLSAAFLRASILDLFCVKNFDG